MKSLDEIQGEIDEWFIDFRSSRELLSNLISEKRSLLESRIQRLQDEIDNIERCPS